MAKEKKQDKTKYLILLLLLITFMAVCITIWALFFRDPMPPLAPDYAPQETEEHMETIPGDTGGSAEQPDSSDGSGSVSLTYTREVTIDLSEKSAEMLFGNPGKSNQNMVIQIIIQDVVIAQSGTLTPGHQVRTLDLLENAEKLLQPGVYEGKFNVLYYHPETGEKAIVNTEIPVTITVQE